MKASKFFLFLFLFLTPLEGQTFPRSELMVRLQEAWEGVPQNFIEVDSNWMELILDKEVSLSLGNCTFSARALKIDSAGVKFYFNLITLPPDLERIFDTLSVSHKQSRVIGPFKGKKNRLYRLIISSAYAGEKEAACQDDPGDSLNWQTDESAHFVYGFIYNSLADFHWNTNKAYLETQFRNFGKIFNFGYRGKFNFSYCPCAAEEVVWDKNSGFALNLAKNRGYVIYNGEQKAVDSPVSGLLFLYRNWGHSPLLLSYGVAGYYTLPHWEAKNLLKENKIYPLKDLIISLNFRKADYKVAFPMAASWTRYLIDSRGVEKFREFYQKASDLNLKEAFQEVYKKTLEESETDWHNFLKNFILQKSDVEYTASLKSILRQYKEVEKYFQLLVEMEPENSNYLQALANAYYLNGNYPAAERIYFSLVSGRKNYLPFLQLLGNFYLMNGKYKEAKTTYESMLSLDTSWNAAYIQLGYLYLLEKNLESASESFQKVTNRKAQPLEFLESFLGVGKVYSHMKRDSIAQWGFGVALDLASKMIEERPGDPLGYYYFGETFLGLGKADSALSYLETAEFLEDRPFYKGKIWLALGKAHHQLKHKNEARYYLRKVTDGLATVPDKKQAREILDKL